MPRRKRLPQHRHLRVGQRIAIFIGHTSADHSSGLQTDVNVFGFLSGSEREKATIGVAALPRDGAVEIEVTVAVRD